MHNLSNVTRAIILLIESELSRRINIKALGVEVLPTPPDNTGSGASVHVHLYHIKECQFNRNLPAPGGAGPIPIQHTPLALILQYVITVVHGSSPAQDSAYVEQEYLGYVARAIHDYPILTGETELSNEFKLLIESGTEVELVIRPAPPEETISYYSAGQQQGLRLSLFVEARVALLEPDPVKTELPAIVLSVGTKVSPMNALTLVNTHSVLTVVQPDKTLTIEATPGRVAVFAAAQVSRVPTNLRNNNHLTIQTGGTIVGDIDLLLEGNGSRVRAPVNRPINGALVNAPSKFVIEPNALTMNVITALAGYVDSENTLRVFDVAPGLYSAALLITAPDGSSRVTNKVAFFVMPQVLSVTATGSEYRLEISGNYLLQIDKADTEVTLSVGSARLKKRAANAPVEQWPGTFTITESTLSFALPAANPPLAGTVPLQLSVNGVPALPYYLEIAGP